ncbi:lisH domain-containing protein ARMC9-like isoform X2 [Bacillus rossius redtenbacheri]|uniref:lisH domain-containing protein ARMC9-like isoform X2 n=1 Tax=Bacillus rossius redtenbacheri TaxID=93214 RepID=UPI002FDDA38D
MLDCNIAKTSDTAVECHEASLVLADVPRLVAADKYCIDLVYEFLASYNFGITADTLLEECQSLGFEVPKTVIKQRIKKESVSNIMKHFTENNLVDFFQAWETSVPDPIKAELEFRKLTFYLHVYFAVLPLTSVGAGSGFPASDNGCVQGEEGGISADGMEVLKEFLETKGRDFSNEPEFLPYYALPFVSDPVNHPSFASVFSEHWKKELQESLEQFLVQCCWGQRVAPRLLRMALEAMRDETPALSRARLQQQLAELEHSYRQLKRRFRRLSKDHQNLIGIATELTGALESTVKGKAVDLAATLDNCAAIFPELFKPSVTPQTVPEGDEECSLGAGSERDRSHAASLWTSFDVDFRKLKNHLLTGSMKTQLLLLQALRWRITRSSVEDREEVMGAYLRHDVLCLHSGGGGDLLGACLLPADTASPHPLQQAAARLVNAVASLRCGRDYLSGAGRDVAGVLVRAITGGAALDAITTDMLLAALQKLSLRHGQRVRMLELGVVEWLVRHLAAGHSSARAYTLEYGTALLMNLCLHRRARQRCRPLARPALELLSALLATEATHALPYVNGTLFSLLSEEQINREAKKMGLGRVLDYYILRSEGEPRRQLEYIARLHRGDCQPDHTPLSDEENEDDDSEEVDLLEEELDSDDPMKGGQGEPCGEQLLFQHYRLLFPYAGVVHPASSHAQPGEVLRRPTTPRSLSSRPKSPPTSPPVDVATTTSQPTAAQFHAADALILENVESELEAEDVEEEVEEASIPAVSLNVPAPDAQETAGGGESSVEPSSSQAGNEEYSEAFSSRPRIPRTPTFQRSFTAW